MRFPGLPGPYAPHHTIPYPPAPCPCPLRHEVRSWNGRMERSSAESPIHQSHPALASASASASASATVPRTASVHLHGHALPRHIHAHTSGGAYPPPVRSPSFGQLAMQHGCKTDSSTSDPTHSIRVPTRARCRGNWAPPPLRPSRHFQPPRPSPVLFPLSTNPPLTKGTNQRLAPLHYLPTQGYFDHSISDGKRHAATYSPLFPPISQPTPELSHGGMQTLRIPSPVRLLRSPSCMRAHDRCGERWKGEKRVGPAPPDQPCTARG